jgi:hypothetical protein
MAHGMVVVGLEGKTMALLSAAQVTVLQKIAKDASFRQAFTANPQQAVKDAGIQLAPAEMQKLTKITPDAVGQLQAGLKSAKMGDADGTNTLLYAVAVAVLIE